MGDRGGTWILSVLSLASMACQNDPPPSTLAAESAHFRLWIDDSLTLPAGRSAQDVILGLEADWVDAQSLFAMPEGRVDYYWLTEKHVGAVCTEFADACASGATVYASTVVHQHELNHAYTYLRFGHRPLPLLTEGIAEAVDCFGTHAFDPSVEHAVPWRDVVPKTFAQDVYEQGKILVRYLMDQQGIARFLDYYGQAPAAKDADGFARNFSAFWGMSLDDVWSAMHVRTPDCLVQLFSLCPCSLPELLPGQEVTADLDLAHPYLRLPALSGDTLALSSASFLALHDCARTRTDVRLQNQVLARVATPHYVSGASGPATSGHYIADACDQAAPFELTPDTTTAVVVSGPGEGNATVYLRLQVATAGNLVASTSITTCGSCAELDGPSCQPVPARTVVPVQGTFVVRMTVSQSITGGETLTLMP